MLILASNSPRRKKLLEDCGLTFKVHALDVDEYVAEKMSPEKLVKTLAFRKAKAVLKECPDDTIIGADTVVVFEGMILGKPIDEPDAHRMLKMLSGNKHEVYTGVCVLTKDKEILFHSMAEVWMHAYDDIQIETYIQTGEPMDKAGSYAIQGLGKDFVEHYTGDFFTIVGLPLKRLIVELNALEEAK